MAELLGKWVNQEIGLSRAITSFDTDFANGYLLGELLYRLHLTSERDFVNGFKNDSHPNSVISNFKSLSTLLSSLHVTCDNILVRDIIQSRTGAALRLLYSIKMNYNKLQQKQQQQMGNMKTIADPLSPSTLSRTGPLGHTQQLPYDRMEQRRLTDTLMKTAHLNHKQKHMNMHQAKFDQIASDQFQHIQESKQHSEETRMNRIHQQQQYEREQMKLKKQQKQEWEEKHIEEWSKSQSLRADRLAADMNFKTTQTLHTEIRHTTQRQHEAQAVHDKIDEFEMNLERIGVETRHDISSTLAGRTGNRRGL